MLAVAAHVINHLWFFPSPGMIKPGSSALSLPEGHRTETPLLVTPGCTNHAEAAEILAWLERIIH